MDEIRHSIIISAYNEEDFILNCLKSVEKAISKIRNIEVIIINNGSIDNTQTRVDEFYDELDSPRKKYYNKFSISHLGLSEARNYGISNSSGEFLSFIDADALVDKYCFVQISKAFEDYNPDIISGTVKFLDKGSSIGYFLYLLHFKTLTPTKKSGFILNKSKTSVIGANMSLKRSVIKKGFFKEIKGRGDDTFLFLYLKNFKKCKEYHLKESIVYNDITSSLITWIKQQFIGGKVNGLIIKNFNSLFLTKKLFYYTLILSIILLAANIYLIFLILFLFRIVLRVKFLYFSFSNLFNSKIWYLSFISPFINIISILINDLGSVYGLIFSKKIIDE